MAVLWHAMSASALRVYHFRHESAAAFAAAESYFAASRPVIVFTTTGPGLTNSLTGLLAARGEGAKVIVLSAYSSLPARGRFAIQDTSKTTMPHGFYCQGPLFHFAKVLEDPSDLPRVVYRIAQGLARPGGFIAHVALPTKLQAMPVDRFDLIAPRIQQRAFKPGSAVLAAAARMLVEDSFAIWLGFGARAAAKEVRMLAERCGAGVFCTPRGKGILPETHPQFVGVTGIGGHESTARWVGINQPARILVLGSRLGEASSLFDPRFMPRLGFIHVDIDREVIGIAYPDAKSLPIAADVGATVGGLLDLLPQRFAPRTGARYGPPSIAPPTQEATTCVRPEILMDALQRKVLDQSDAILLAESGNAFIWATHRLCFARPARYRVSTGFGAMGHAASGVVGAALAQGQRAVALVGDGSMLMQNEINTAVKYAARAVWIILNDARYGMCYQGMASLGLLADATFPAVDFAAFARAQGADGVRVLSEDDLDAALSAAMQSAGPFVVDVLIDREALAPAGARNRGLARQLSESSVADTSFPIR